MRREAPAESGRQVAALRQGGFCARCARISGSAPASRIGLVIQRLAIGAKPCGGVCIGQANAKAVGGIAAHQIKRGGAVVDLRCQPGLREQAAHMAQGQALIGQDQRLIGKVVQAKAWMLRQRVIRRQDGMRRSCARLWRAMSDCRPRSHVRARSVLPRCSASESVSKSITCGVILRCAASFAA